VDAGAARHFLRSVAGALGDCLRPTDAEVRRALLVALSSRATAMGNIETASLG
jgi:hypothetical protein